MVEDRFADLIRHSYQLPIEEEQPMEDTMLAAGPITSDVPQTGVRLGRAGVTLQQSAKAGGLDKPLIALLDTLAGAMRGATGAAIGLPGDIRSIVDLINQEGAEAVMGKRMFPTSEEVLQSNKLPQVVPAGAPNAAERQKTVDVAQAVGEFLPAPGLLDVPKVVKGATKAVQATKGMPVGMSTQMVGEGVSELGFYSAAKEAVDAIQQPKGTGEQFLKQIEKTPGVKPEEIKWTGLDEFLAGKKSVTKAEVQEYLDKNRVEVKEVQLGDIKLNEKSEYALPEVLKVLKENQSNGYSGMRVTLANDYDAYQALTKKFPNLEDTDNWEDRVLSELIGPDAGGTKFSKYQLPGGTNYREIFMTLPTKTVTEDEARIILGASPDAKLSQADIAYASRKNKDEYIVPRAHSADGEADINRIAHMRVNDRIDADGKKVFFIEEIQSDWHQTGRKQGYKTKLSKEETAELKDLRKKELDGDGLLFSDDADRLTELEKKIESGVPDAPFKTTWHELALKRAIQLASEGGYDRVAFTTGKTQAARYDLSKQVKMISAMPDKNGTYNIYIEGNNGDALFRNQNGFGEYGQKIVTPEEFEELVGKDVAKTIMQKSDELNRGKVSKDQFKFYDSKPADLTIGGEGMKGFYDDILPKFLNKYAKKWDAKVGMTDIITQKASDNYPQNIRRLEGGRVKKGIDKFESVQYIDITPKMKESVLTKGQPLFAVGGAGAAMQQEDNK